MLPILLYNNMEGSSNSLDNNQNSSFGSLYDDNVILNSVRNRKKVSELPNCPVCSCTVRHGELESHLALEVDRLQKLSNGGSKRKLSVTVSSSLAQPGPSSDSVVAEDQDVDVTGCLGGDVYQRIHTNRLRRLRARRRSTPPPAQGQCPVCDVTRPTSRLQRHALRCLKRTGAIVDDDVPDTSSEEGSIDVENDEPPGGGGFGMEYQWCGEWRVRASALAQASGDATCVRRASSDHALVVDGDEDTELYGPAQYSPSRIAPDAVISPAEEQTEAPGSAAAPEAPSEPMAVESQPIEVGATKVNGLVEASAETRIQALKAKIKDLECKQNTGDQAKCLICLGAYVSPAVSIQCWHVYCEVCWLQSLRAKKICPLCNLITTTEHLRRIYIVHSCARKGECGFFSPPMSKTLK